MFSYEGLPRHNVLCVDMKSFYASCECVALKLDPMKALLAVVGDAGRDGSVVLSASPALKKKYGIGTGSRLFEIKSLKDKSIRVISSRMNHYLAVSKQIIRIFSAFVPPDALHVYSVDESWLTLDGTEKLWGTPREAAQKIIDKIKEEAGIPASIGIGDNKFLAKIALDVYGKKMGIAEIRYEESAQKLHHLPVDEMWGIGRQMKIKFNKIGIFTIGDLANADMNAIKSMFGVVGKTLFLHAWGVDFEPVFYDAANPPANAFNLLNDEMTDSMKSIGHGVTLLEDYAEESNIVLVIKELVDQISERLRKKHLTAKTVHLSVQYSRSDRQKGFSRQITLGARTDDAKELLDACLSIFYEHYEEGNNVRLIRAVAAKLAAADSLDPFDATDNAAKTKRKLAANAFDEINLKYGKGAIRPASSYTEKSIFDQRFKK